jgi:hypothetical protein
MVGTMLAAMGRLTTAAIVVGDGRRDRRRRGGARMAPGQYRRDARRRNHARRHQRRPGEFTE